MVGKKAHHVTNEILNAELSSLTKNQKKALLGLVKAASGGMGVASVKVVKEPPTSTSQNISKKKKNANRTQIGGGGGGEGKSGTTKPSQRKKRKNGAEGGEAASSLAQKMKEVRAVFQVAEEIGVLATGNSRVGRMSAKKKLREKMPIAVPKKSEKVTSVLKGAKERRQAIIEAKRKQKQVPGLKGAATQAIDKKGEPPSKQKTNINKRKTKKPQKAEKQQKVSKPEVLETQMDTYWFEAGKGKDPKEMKLDSSMNEYWAKKPPIPQGGEITANN